MRVRWLDSAIDSLDAQGEYIARNDPEAAARIVSSILSSVERLATFPASGRPGRIPGTRELIVPGTPFIIPYRIRAGTVEILRVLHASRKWPGRS